jgi:hypothetical protein
MITGSSEFEKNVFMLSDQSDANISMLQSIFIYLFIYSFILVSITYMTYISHIKIHNRACM